jgi:hypothetical protein
LPDSDNSVTFQVLARIFMLPTTESGKSNPISAGYRPNHNFGSPSNRAMYIGQLDIPPGESVYPGETRDLVVSFLNTDELPRLLQVGTKWRIQEGLNHVGNAEVLKILLAAV